MKYNHELNSFMSVSGDRWPAIAVIHQVERLTRLCGSAAKEAGWRQNADGSAKVPNFGEKIALVHSELSEALEGFRSNKMDEHCVGHTNTAVELSDALIRIFDMADWFGIDLSAAFAAKLQYNLEREDHKLENRNKEGGKKF